MKLLIILPAKIQAEMPFQQRCKEQVVKYSPKVFWKVHANWFNERYSPSRLANLYKRKGNRHSRDNHRGTALLSIASKILARFILSWLINQHATILDEKCWEFCTFVPTERLSCGFDATMAPPLAPPWSVLFRRGQKWSSNVFLEKEGSICSCQCFQDLYLQSRHSKVHFS